MIKKFNGKHSWLSNFWPAPTVWLGRTWPTSEHAYQAAKSKNPVGVAMIAIAKTPGQAKKFGRKIELREEWLKVRVWTMRQILWRKFQDKGLREKLLATGDVEIQEGNSWHDTFWGVCLGGRKPCECKGTGQNQLGKILMEIRKEIVEL